MHNRFELTERAVDAYEAQKVVAIFRPLAEATLAVVPVRPGDSVLDLACGTGIMGRVVRKRHGPGIAITGADLSEAMIAKARALSAPLGGSFDWRVADAAALPFADDVFSMCFCQQGVQFFPDVAAVIAEIGRVLAPGGRVALTVWAPPNDYFLAQSAALTRHVGSEAGEKALVPFAFRGIDRLPDILRDAGFADPAVRTIAIERVIADAARGIAEDIDGSPMAPLVHASGPHTMTAVVADIMAACDRFLRSGDLVIRQEGHLVTAAVP